VTEGPLTTLYLDLNAYFASVEQQVQPNLRGKPVAVAPITHDSGCCIAVSYEAKAFGVKTGTRVGEARRLCPCIQIIDARPRLYVLMHQRVLRAVDRHIPVHKVYSIDEMACRLDSRERTEQAATALAKRIKQALRETCGGCMRASIGVAQNKVLAKLATDMQKPDGLVVLTGATREHRIAGLGAQELAGIGPKMAERLEAKRVKTIGDMLALTEPQMRDLFGGIIGARWWHWLRGLEVEETETRKNSIGHQHVLAPALRTREGARAVSQRLLLKAAARMRHLGYAARKMTLGLRFPGDGVAGPWGGASWDKHAALGEGCTDTGALIDALNHLWGLAPSRGPMMVGVTLHDLVAPGSYTLPLFSAERKQHSLAAAMDLVNKKFGANTLYTAGMQDVRSHGSGGIAFNFVPDLAVPDSVKSRQRSDDRKKEETDAELEAMIEESLAFG